MAAAKSAAESATALLLRPDNGILGTAPGKSLDSPGEAAVIVYVDKNKPGIAVPEVLNGVRTLVIPTDAASLNARHRSPRRCPRWKAFICRPMFCEPLPRYNGNLPRS